MESIIHNLQDSLSSLFNKDSLAVINNSIRPYIDALKEFHFSFLNPVFIALILFALLILSRIWGSRKALSYCLIVSAILCLATMIASNLDLPLGESVFTSKNLVNGTAILIIAIVTMYYIFLKNSD